MAGSDEELTRLRGLLAAERTGRINAERALHNLRKAQAGSSGPAQPPGAYTLLPIGYARSPFPDRRGAPRQGLLAPAVRAAIVLEPSVPTEALAGLDAFSHAWVSFLFHLNTSSARAAAAKQPTAWHRLGRTWTAKVYPPGMYGDRTGVFATRSPHRPNELGLSLVRVEGVCARRRALLVAGCDLVDGTPVVDIKPAGPYDCGACLPALLLRELRLAEVVPRGSHSTPGADRCSGFVAASSAALKPLPQQSSLPRFPAWVSAPLQQPRACVAFSPDALAALREHCLAGRCQFYGPRHGWRADGTVRSLSERDNCAGSSASCSDDSESEVSSLVAALSQVISLDIRGVHQGRGRVGSARRGNAASAALAAPGSSVTSATSGPAAVSVEVGDAAAVFVEPERSDEAGTACTSEGIPCAASSSCAIPTLPGITEAYELRFDSLHVVLSVQYSDEAACDTSAAAACGRIVEPCSKPDSVESAGVLVGSSALTFVVERVSLWKDEAEGKVA